MRGRPAVVALLLVGGAAAGCATHGSGGGAGAPAAVRAAAAPASRPVPADNRLVLVSGRDDHGMVSLEQVPVYDAVEGRRVVGRIADGTLARVVETDGQWQRVTTVEGPATGGWVDDFHLRGEARLVGPAPSCRARLAPTGPVTTGPVTTRRGSPEVVGGTLVVVRRVRGDRVLVATEGDPAVRGWARREDLQELPPQGGDCGDIPPDDRHAH